MHVVSVAEYDDGSATNPSEAEPGPAAPAAVPRPRPPGLRRGVDSLLLRAQATRVHSIPTATPAARNALRASLPVPAQSEKYDVEVHVLRER